MSRLLTISVLTASITINAMASENKKFDYVADRFADIEVLRYQVPGFEDLSLNQKQLVYYLTEAAISGRDILWDQNNKYNLQLRQLLESIYNDYKGDKTTDDYKAFEKYLKQVWFGNGFHHHYSMDKFVPEFSVEFFDKCVSELPAEKKVENIDILKKIIFAPEFMAKKVNQAEGQDLIVTSATNLYEGVTQKEVEDYYNALKDTTDTTPISYGLNTKIVKVNGKITELPFKKGGLYSDAITRIIDNLQKANRFAENDMQRRTIEKLIEYYTTGNLRT
ncbi:MAG: dipeptidyl peptidase 3, partial [Paramuribaculum sp.]|nr:dipeptidyl peptidase 3 [Paramuribaculum sp.]